MIFEACTSHRLRPTPARAAAQVPRSSQEVAVLQTAIFEYLGTLRTGLLSEEKSARIQFLTQAVVTFESMSWSSGAFATKTSPAVRFPSLHADQNEGRATLPPPTTPQLPLHTRTPAET